MHNPLIEGAKLNAIWVGDQTGYSTEWRNVKDIVIVMVPGHMASLPFAQVNLTNDKKILIPCHNATTIEME